MLPQMSERLSGKRLQDRPELSGLGARELAALPDDEKPEIYRWFYLPTDDHYTDYGNERYGDVVAKFLIESYLSLRSPETAAEWR